MWNRKKYGRILFLIPLIAMFAVDSYAQTTYPEGVYLTKSALIEEYLAWIRQLKFVIDTSFTISISDTITNEFVPSTFWYKAFPRSKDTIRVCTRNGEGVSIEMLNHGTHYIEISYSRKSKKISINEVEKSKGEWDSDKALKAQKRRNANKTYNKD